jgi:type II secretory pathway component PulF
MQLVSGQKRSIDGSVKLNSAYWLSEFDAALLTAGEESGKMDSAFRLLARYYTSRAKIIRDTISGLIITFITLNVFLLVFPIGYLQDLARGIMNNQYEQCLPFIIEKIVAFGILYGGIWFLIFASQGNRGGGWRAAIESLFSAVPLLGTSVKYLAVARLAMALNALLSAGVPVIRSWELSAAACGSPHLKNQIIKWTPELESGVTPSEMVAQIRYFPDMFAQLYQSGEISGKLDETLTRLHTYFEDEGFRKLQAFCRVLNFVIYFTIAITVAIFVINFWRQYFGAALGALQ